MKKQNQSFTNYFNDNVDTKKLSKKVKELLKQAVPNSVLGMLAVCGYDNDGIIFYDRYKLVPHEQQNYEIIDLKSSTSLYQNIALFTSALNIIFYANRPVVGAALTDKLIYELDQEYFRCTEDIKFFQKKCQVKDRIRREMFTVRLIDRQRRLSEIKSLLSKKY
jgi:hypothetical protein